VLVLIIVFYHIAPGLYVDYAVIRHIYRGRRSRIRDHSIGYIQISVWLALANN